MKLEERLINRRSAIKWAGGSIALSSSLALLGCNGGSNESASSTSSVASSSSSPSSSSSSSVGETGVDITTSDLEGNMWASGGTSSLQAVFPPEDPFEQGLGSVCKVTSEYTLGPCYFNPDQYRSDISEGEPGVPVILVLKLVDASCQPLANADIDIWHCDAEGIYSGNSSGSSDASRFNAGFCTGNDNRALNSRWFRGVQKTNDQGMAYFKTCFPGWYRGRTTHIHFKVIHNNVQFKVSQFCFDDTLSNNIYTAHSDYTGQTKDTLNRNDNVFGSDYSDYEFYIKANADLSMTAYKTIQISG